MIDIAKAYETFEALNTPSEMVDAFDPAITPSSTRTTYKNYLKKLPVHLENQHTHESVALALALLQANRSQAIYDMREKGFFRLSRYGFGDSACATVDALLLAGERCGLNEETLEYLVSVQALHSLRPQITPLYSYISDQVNRYKKTILKSMFVVIDRMFLGAWQGGDRNLPSDQPLHHSMEDFAEAFSTVIGVFRKSHGITLSDWQDADPDGLNSTNIYLFVLTAAAQLNSFKQAETMLDGLPYKAGLRGKDVYISSIDPLFEKTVRLGYVQQEKQSEIRFRKMAEFYHSPDAGLPSLMKETKRLFDAGLHQFVYVNEHPQRRLVFAIPEGLGVEGLIGYEGTFLEEELAIMRMDVDDFSDDNPLLREIKPGIRAFHFLRAQRFFSFIAYMYEFAFENLPDEDKQFITAQSAINIMPRKGLIKSLSLAIPEEIVDSVIEMLVLPAAGDLIDIQYFPLIAAEDDIICSSRVLSASNIIRNLYVSNRLHKGWEKGCDPMIIRLKSALIKAGFRVEMEVDLPFGESLDADLLAYKDGLLLLLECKHMYHPCNMHELRNPLWHVQKGADQLNVRLPFLDKKKHLDDVLSLVKWGEVEINEIRGAIVTSTRVLHGWRTGGYPVIQAKEFINVLTGGIIVGPEGNYHFWEGEKLTVGDVGRYLDGSTVIEDQLESMEPRLEYHPYGGSQLVYETWKNNEEEHGKRLAKKYKFTARS
ncbi:hypothetical protein RJC98_09690 [Pseudomonas allii]|uniref:Uncharacterized protein n=1 Tax=Pseudomonas allii TaxID=2740531 RepID=A0ACC6LB26_9PSED|nr:hypothetical protein [Pseudomonas allii]MDR9875455.1 hypothetical protein [Pseudomonas allii]